MDPDRLIQWRPQQWRSIYSPNKPLGEREVGCCMQPIYLYVWDINRKKTPPPHLCFFLLWLDADESTWQAIYLFVFLADKCLSACVCLPVWLPVHICNVMLWCSMCGSSLFASLHGKVRVKGQLQISIQEADTGAMNQFPSGWWTSPLLPCYWIN